MDRLARGRELAIKGRWAEAAQAFRRVVEADPACPVARHSLATALLGAGNYEEGFPLYALRRAAPGFAQAPRVPWPEWQGEDLRGKHILLFPEQGLGDEIQFARFAPLLRDRGAKVTLFCAPALASLFARLGVTVMASAGRVDFEEPDVWAFAFDVPARLGLGLSQISGAPYLDVQAPRRGGCGIVRRGNPSHFNDANRSMPDTIRLPFEAQDLSPAATGAATMLETATILAGLDAVVSVDTSVAHLAGAMGKRCLLVLPSIACDWRWMRDRADSPWYASVEIFRHPAGRSDWDAVLTDVAAALR